MPLRKVAKLSSKKELHGGESEGIALTSTEKFYQVGDQWTCINSMLSFKWFFTIISKFLF